MSRYAYRVTDTLPEFLSLPVTNDDEEKEVRLISKQINTFTKEEYEKRTDKTGIEFGLELFQKKERLWQLERWLIPDDPTSYVLHNAVHQNSGPALNFNANGVYVLRFNEMEWKNHAAFGGKPVRTTTGHLVRSWSMDYGLFPLHRKVLENGSGTHPIVLSVSDEGVNVIWATVTGERSIPGAVEGHFSRHTEPVYGDQTVTLKPIPGKVVILRLHGSTICRVTRVPECVSPSKATPFAKS